MSITVPDASTPEYADGTPPPAAVEPARRGTTTIATSAVERLVGWAAASTPGVSSAQLTGVRGWLHSDDDDDGAVEADVDEEGAGLRVGVTVAVAYPEPVAEIAAQVRERVTAALHDQLAMATERVDVTVTELRRPTRDRVALSRRVQ